MPGLTEVNSANRVASDTVIICQTVFNSPRDNSLVATIALIFTARGPDLLGNRGASAAKKRDSALSQNSGVATAWTPNDEAAASTDLMLCPIAARRRLIVAARFRRLSRR